MPSQREGKKLTQGGVGRDSIRKQNSEAHDSEDATV